MTNFAPGQLVRIIRYGFDAGDEIDAVKRVTKRFVELDGGSKWSLDGHHGYPYGKRTRARIVPATEKDIDEVSDQSARQNAIEFLRHTKLEDLPTAALVAAAAALKESK
jgi:hypothetical protein